MPSLPSSAIGGRAASVARRHALSAGKAALPPAAERVSAGRRGHAAAPPAVAVPAAPVPAVPVVMPAVNGSVKLANGPASVVNGSNAKIATSAPLEVFGGPSGPSLGGRQVSLQRRRQLSAGKAAVQSPAAASSASLPEAGVPAAGPFASTGVAAGVARDAARARRAEHSRFGRGDAPPAAPSRLPRVGSINYAPKVVASPTQGGQTVTGSRIGRGLQVTGDERGVALPVSGTQYIAADGGAAWRAGGPKVGLSRTGGGALVSGTLVRSNVPVTGDEAGSGITITGEADQRPDDDLTARASGGYTSAQFARQADPHGTTVFGTNLGRSLRVAGSRDRRRTPAIESTEGGLPVTGSAIGRSVRVTGDDPGACLAITGDQYLAPARRQAECGGRLGGSAPAAQLATQRPDPVSGTKVNVSRTWTGQRVTGVDVEHHPRVTGDAPGSCATITGSPYQGTNTMHGWCDDAAVGAAEGRLARRAAPALVTGDAPMTDPAVTGALRGAGRDITGTPYASAAGPAPELPAQPVALVDERFSVRSPQRAAQLRAAANAAPGESASGASRITGSFAVGQGKVTGNLEFLFRPRSSPRGEDTAARLRLTGEGRSSGPRITGAAFTEHGNVTGTEGSTASERNASERAGKPQAFAGSRNFKVKASTEEPKHLVTGMFGYSSDSAAKVTLSGGAQG